MLWLQNRINLQGFFGDANKKGSPARSEIGREPRKIAQCPPELQARLANAARFFDGDLFELRAGGDSATDAEPEAGYSG